MKKFLKKGMVCVAALVMLTGCGQSAVNSNNVQNETTTASVFEPKVFEGAVNIVLSDSGITVDGSSISTDIESAVYAANDIVYYEAGKDFTYGEGEEKDEHTKEEADKHTVVHITEPGTYALSGSISAGQIAIDLGEDAEEDPEAVVNLIMNNADITCSVAPAVIFYNVYECQTTDEESATNTVDTASAGANVLIADGTVNNVTGSYVAKIYKSVELNEAGTEVVDSKKLHKYDGAFYSKMSMNVNGDENGTGVLNINAENEGLDTELHLTINGGNINITSGNDGINTNEDGISVTTVNGGNLTITVNGSTGEGDGIDSNGWLVINGGKIRSYACSTSGDAGIDSDMGIHINGGDIVATGNMLDRISESAQNYAVFSFSDKQSSKTALSLKDENQNVKSEFEAVNDFSYLIVSSEDLTAGTYTLWNGDSWYQGSVGDGGMGGMMQGGMPSDMTKSENGEMSGSEAPENMGRHELETNADGTVTLPDGTTIDPSQMKQNDGRQGNMAKPENGEMPGGEMPGGEMPGGEMSGGEMPEGGKGQFGGGRGQAGGMGNGVSGEISTEFVINDGGSYFNQVSLAK